MFRFLQYLLLNSRLALFLVLEAVCFFLIIKYNNTQRDIYINTSNIFSGWINNNVSQIKEYVELEEKYKILHKENSDLFNELYQLKSTIVNLTIDSIIIDTSYQMYHFTPANVIDNSLNRFDNYITLDVGRNDSIDVGMGVVSSDGIVGVIDKVTGNYSRAISLLHRQSKIAVSVKNLNYFGTLTWDGDDPFVLSLEEIPLHLKINIQDTVVTSGYSSIFPKNMNIGIISNIEKSNSTGFYDIEVQPFCNFAKISEVYIIKNYSFEEIKTLEGYEE